MVEHNIEVILKRGDDCHVPSLENRVSYQFEFEGNDLLGYRTAVRRNRTVIDWTAAEVARINGPKLVVDLGCGYGNYLLMINARCDKPEDLQLVGMNISQKQLQFGQAFSRHVEGYSRCEFREGNVEQPLPFESGSVNVVIMTDVLEHLEQPRAVLNEIHRVLKPGGIFILTTPLKGGFFKQVAAVVNKLTAGRLYKNYYAGKGAQLDDKGHPVMEVDEGHDHISEMNYAELRDAIKSANLTIEQVQTMPIMSGSSWFSKHGFLLSAILILETIHDTLNFPSWSHGVCFKLRK